MKRAITLAAAFVAAATVLRALARPGKYPPAMNGGEPPKYTAPDADGDPLPPGYRLAEAELRATWGDQ